MLLSAYVKCLIKALLKVSLMFIACLCNAAGERYRIPGAPHPTQRAPVLRQGTAAALHWHLLHCQGCITCTSPACRTGWQGDVLF